MRVKECLEKFWSGSIMFLTITWKFRIILQNICRRVIGSAPINISPSNIFPTMLLQILTKIVRLFSAAVGIIGFISIMSWSVV